MAKRWRRRGETPPARVWDRGAMASVRTICQECYNHCGVLVSVEDGRMTRLRGDPAHPLNRGHEHQPFICFKGVTAHESAYSPKRIKYPALKTRAGGWERIAWDDALDILAQRIAAHAPEAFVGFGLTDFYDFGVIWRLLLAEMGSPHLTVYGDFCGATTQIADILTVGEGFTRYPYGPDIANTNLIFVVASNPSVSFPNQWVVIKDAAKRGVKLIVVDPRHTETAAKADTWIRIKPGADAALGLAMLNVIIAEGLHDREFVERWCVGFDALAAHVRPYTPEWAAEKTWVAAETIRELARLYATTKPAAMLRRIGTAHHALSTQTARIYTLLIAITGNIDVPGGNLLVKNWKGLMPNTEFFRSRPQWRELLPPEVLGKQFGADRFPLYVGPNSIIKVDSSTQTIKAMQDGRVKTALVMQTNPVSSYPNTREVREAFSRLDFLVVGNQTYTPTAALADLVLPVTHWSENYALLQDVFNRCVTACKPVVDPLAEAKSGIDVLLELRRHLEGKGYIKRELIPWRTQKDYFEERAAETGASFDELVRRGYIEYAIDYREYERKGFATPSGKVELASSVMEDFGYDALPNYRDVVEDVRSTLGERAADYPLILLTGARDKFNYCTKHRDNKSYRKRMPHPELEISSERAQALGIADGDWVAVETPWGVERCLMTARLVPEMHADVVHAPAGWYYPEFAELDPLAGNINSVLPNGAPYEPIIGIPTLKPLVCRVVKVEGVQGWEFQGDLARPFQADRPAD